MLINNAIPKRNLISATHSTTLKLIFPHRTERMNVSCRQAIVAYYKTGLIITLIRLSKQMKSTQCISTIPKVNMPCHDIYQPWMPQKHFETFELRLAPLDSIVRYWFYFWNISCLYPQCSTESKMAKLTKKWSACCFNLDEIQANLWVFMHVSMWKVSGKSELHGTFFISQKRAFWSCILLK